MEGMTNAFNFARAPFKNERLPHLIFLVMTILVLGLTIAHGLTLTRYLLREREELDIKVDLLEKEIQNREQAIAEARQKVEAAPNALRNERQDFLAQLYRHKSFSWTGLFNELESISPGPVRLTSIVPIEDKGRITVALTLVGKTLDDILKMVSKLEASAIFATVFPLSEVELEELDAGGGIAATLSLEYVEPSVTEQAAELLVTEEMREDNHHKKELRQAKPVLLHEKKP